MPGPLLTKRVDDLESQLAFQEDTIESLNQLVTAQSELLTQLQKQVRALTAKHQQFQEQQNDTADTNAHEPPPHY
ncbi:SlyX protein [Pseudidiomarina planktonica]|uniref:Protein SlyX homolog n=1 Tax=Pseudidiomarina planktonica TaxID=1323738 RepID=A0A1Y6FXK9_9GAMM|nr:SlyX family protein [Pseudidiomarina planktonica]RUO63834.1 SlyX protein [Pseudidiomarina planktonica]SMQ80098.1 SlyX protein [Pseudidiomarina planktonica]